MPAGAVLEKSVGEDHCRAADTEFHHGLGLALANVAVESHNLIWLPLNCIGGTAGEEAGNTGCLGG
jgi:hypothetical protein